MAADQKLERRSRVRAWLSDRDPGLAALRRAARAAIVMPIAFFLTTRLVDNKGFSLFVAFGCLSSLLLVEFSGPRKRQLREAGGMFLASAMLILLGTVVSGVVWLTVLAMAVVAFLAIFVGMLKPSLAKMTSPVLVAFILAITVTPSSITVPERLLAWSAAALASLSAILFLWPNTETKGDIEPALRDAFRAFTSEVVVRPNRDVPPNRYSKPLRQAVRTAIAMGTAVLIADLIRVQHAFWVILGTFVVLCSNAIGTGQNVIRAISGTVIGILIASALIAFLGTNVTVFWILLPIAILFTGFASKSISFAAGQAGFTVVLLLISHIINPVGWKVGLVRLEDIALACAISAIVGFIFWPREPVPSP